MKIYKVYKMYYTGFSNVETLLKSFTTEQVAKQFCAILHRYYGDYYKIIEQQIYDKIPQNVKQLINT